MNIRGNVYTTIDSLFTYSDNKLLDSLNDEEQKIVINHNYQHIDEFEKYILKLIKNYERLLNDAALAKCERELLNSCLLFDKQLQDLSESINVSTQNISTHSQQMVSITNQTDPYLHAFLELNAIMKTVIDAKNTILTSSEKLQKVSDQENFGIKKIENFLSFCINLIINFPSTAYLNKNSGEIYSSLLTSLAEFYYNHGKNLFAIDEQNDNISNLKMPTPDSHIVISLLLFMMSGSIKSSTLENSCYVHLLHNVLNAKIDEKIWMKDFDLASFAIESPTEFTKLYHYLFNENQLFSKYLYTMRKENNYLTLKAGIFNLYMSFAAKQLAKKSMNHIVKINYENEEKTYRDQAKKLFTHCLDVDLATTINIVENHFPDLDINIQLAIYFFKKNDPRSLSVSVNIFSQVNALTEDELAPYTKILLMLFKFWLRQDDISLKKFALEKLAIYFKSNNHSAEALLVEYAKENIIGAILYTDLIIAVHSVGRIEIAKILLNMYKNINNSHILFNLYRISVMEKLPNYLPLFEAAEMGNISAKNELFLLNTHFYLGLINILLDKLRDHSFLAFQVLNANCHTPDIELELAIYALHHPISDGEGRIENIYKLAQTNEIVINKLDQNNLLKFYDYLIRYTDDPDKRTFAVSKLKSYLGINDDAYNKLLYHAMQDYSIVLDLVKFCLDNDQKNMMLIQLKSILEWYHKDNLTLQGNYYLYLIEKKVNRLIELNLLKQIFEMNTELGISELIFLYYQLNKAQSYNIMLNGSLTMLNRVLTFDDAISYFENELAEYVRKKEPYQATVAEIMSLHYLHQTEILKAEQYIQICLELNPKDTFHKILIDDKLDHFSDTFKKLYLEQKRIFIEENNATQKPVTSSIKSKMMLFGNDKRINRLLEDEKFELKKIIVKANLPDKERFDILDQIQKVRVYDDLFRIKSQVLEYLNESVKLRKSS